MKRLALITFLISLTANTAMAMNQAPEGLWLTQEGKAVVKVEKCEGSLCGTFYWLRDQDKLWDEENPDPELQKRPLCGLKILYGFVQDSDEPELWDDGNVYKADDGDLYDGYIKVINNDELYLRGYIGISLLGKSQTWKRVARGDYEQCKDPGPKPVSVKSVKPSPKKRNFSGNQ